MPARRWVPVFGLAGALPAAQKKPKPPDVEIVEAVAHRGESIISINGRVRNTGERPIKQLVLSFTFFAPGKQPVTTQKTEIDEELLDKGQEATFRVELQAPPRSVEFSVDASDTAFAASPHPARASRGRPSPSRGG